LQANRRPDPIFARDPGNLGRAFTHDIDGLFDKQPFPGLQAGHDDVSMCWGFYPHND
jgi:hypothetical protein